MASPVLDASDAAFIATVMEATNAEDMPTPKLDQLPTEEYPRSTNASVVNENGKRPYELAQINELFDATTFKLDTVIYRLRGYVPRNRNEKHAYMLTRASVIQSLSEAVALLAKDLAADPDLVSSDESSAPEPGAEDNKECSVKELGFNDPY